MQLEVTSDDHGVVRAKDGPNLSHGHPLLHERLGDLAERIRRG
jgi:hypothetical protein